MFVSFYTLYAVIVAIAIVVWIVIRRLQWSWWLTTPPFAKSAKHGHPARIPPI